MRYPQMSLSSGSVSFRARALKDLRVPVCFMMLACAAFPPPLVAQTSTINPDVLVTNATQTPIEGVGHDYIHDLSETVNPQNGQVSIRIAGPSPHERGPNLPHYAYMYDTSGRESMTFSPELVQCSSPDPGYAPAECDAVVTGPSPAYYGQYGLGTPAPTPLLLNTILRLFSSQSYTSPQVPGNVNGPVTYGCQYYAYSHFDSHGGFHDLNLHTLISQSTTPGPGCGELGYETNYFGGDSSVKADCQQNVSCSAVDAATSSGLLSAGLLTTGNTSIEDTNGNGDNGTGRPMSYTNTTVQGYPQPPNWMGGQPTSYVGLSTITLPGVSAAYTYNYSTFSRSGSVGLSASVNPYSTAGGWCQLNELGNMTQTTSFADVSSLLLPNGQSYTFGYDGQWGLVNSITYPTGGKVTYTWGVNSRSEPYNANTPSTWNGILLNEQQNCYFEFDLPVVTKRVVDFDGTHPALEQDFAYSTTWGTNGFWSSKTTTVTTKDLVRGTTTGVTKYNYIPMFPPVIATGTSSKSVIPHENTVVYQDGAGNTLRTVVKVWLGVDLLGAECEILDNGMVSGKFYQYQQVPSPAYVWSGGMSDQVTDLAEYDYTQGVTSACVQPSSSTAPARETKTQYATIPSSALWQPAESEAIPQTNDRPSVLQIYDHGTLISETDIAYDQTSVVSVSPTAYDHDETNLGPSQVAGRGNATTITKKCVQNCSTNSVITAQYDETGQIVGVTDANGNTTTLSYADNYSTGGTPPGNTNTYVTTITRPTTNGVNHISSFAYHYTFGELTSATDENLQVTTYQYNDTWGRPTLGNAPDGGQTQKLYNDSAPSPTVTTCQLISGTAGATCSAASPPTGWKTTLDTMDGVGHLVQAALVSDPSGTDYSAIAYDGLGRTYQKYNPTRCSTPTTNCGETTWGMTTYIYDALNRTTKVAEPDGSAVSTTYSGNTSTVTDEAGNQRTSTADAFGRLTAVVEAPGVSGLKLTTQYQYDARNDLLCAVQQGTSTSTFTNCASAPATWRPRTFVYDSLSRLTSATNPESGTISYTYDANGNLIQRVAPSPNQVSSGTATVTTSYTYDALNRLTGKSYSDTYTQNPATPSATYGYDGVLLSCPDPVGFAGKSATNGVGRRTAMCFSVGSKSWQYDPMGRIYTENDRFVGLVPPLYEYNIGTNSAGVPSISTDTDYRYDLNGDLATVFYPGQGIPTEEFYTTVGGAGRITTAGDATYHALTSGIYTPDGQLTTGTVCNNTCNASNTYNNRLQPVLISAATTSGTPILNLTYNFNLGNGTTGSDNGNVIQIANGKNSNRTQNFVYDPLNRIWQAYTNGSNWGESYSPNTYAAGTVFSAANAGIDAWGNLGNRSPVTGKTNYEPLSCAPSTSNRLNTCYTYDAAGNLITNGTATYTYDAENRLIATGGDSYIYDGDGQRVEKCTEATNAQGVAEPGLCASNATGRFYWLHAGGGTLAESDLGGNWTAAYGLIHGQIIDRVDLPANVMHYYFHDHLNSTNVVTDIDGNILNESDYYPYGGEIVITSGDTNRYKFTGKERDSESGLDNFGARYNASTMGRFMTPDPKMPSVRHLLNPQKWNKYAYVLNNPLALVDPDGKEEMTFVYRTFIAPQSINFMGNTYAGDNRGFSTASNASSRSTITVRIETDPAIRPGNPIISQTSSAGESRELDANGNTIKSATATTGLPVATGTRDANGDAVINITQDVKNPLSPVPQFMTPGISANLNVTATPNGSTVSATGTASNFPSQELNVTGANGTTTPIFQFTPQQGASPFSLFLPDRNVNATAHPCPSGQSGCSQ